MFNTFKMNIFLFAGHLTIVVGPIGSGKSSLLMAMLGELNQLSGSIITWQVYHSLSRFAFKIFLSH